MTGVELTMLAAAAGAGGGLLGAVSSLQQGKAAKESADFQAAQLEQQAGQDLAVAQRAAAEERRKADIVSSNLRAAVGAGGGNLDDPTVSKLDADIAGQGELNALTALYTGKESSISKKTQAEAARVSGRAANKAGKIGAISGLLGATGSVAGGLAGASPGATKDVGKGFSATYITGTAPWKF